MAISTDINTALLNQVLELYSWSETQMLEKVAKRVKKGITEVGWNELKLGEVQAMKQEIIKDLANTNRLTKYLCNKGIIEAYMSGVKSANADAALPLTMLRDMLPPHMQRMVLEMNNLIDGTSVQILRSSEDAYRSVISEASLAALSGTETREAAMQRALNKFAAQGITGFVDKAGRNWELASYTEMAVRTSTANAALQGHIDRNTELGLDLVIVTSFGKTCLKCAPWEGKVLSISGKDPKYPSLDFAKSSGLFHPNCKHTITTYFEDIDDEGHMRPHRVEYNQEAYNETQKQRYNERQIRRWKRMQSVAITPQAQQRAAAKVREWQDIQRKFIKKTGLRRDYVRESIAHRVGNAAKAENIINYSMPAYKAPVKAPGAPKAAPKASPKPAFKLPDLDTPKVNELSYYKNGSYLGGAGDKSIYRDADGQQYIFKPAVTKYGDKADYKAYIQEAVSKIQKVISPKGNIDISAVDIDGKKGTIQKLVKTVDTAELENVQHGLSAKSSTYKQLQREHVLDWLVGNFDSHYKNFITDIDGNIIGVDKEQAFRYINEEASHKMSYTYHPNSKYGENEPIYNKMFNGYAKGELDLDPEETLQYIKKIEAIPDKTYRKNFEQYAYAIHNNAESAEDLLDSIVKRKQSLRKDYEEFYSKLLTERNGLDTTFQFGKAPKIAKAPKALKQTKVKMPKNFDPNNCKVIGRQYNLGINSDIDEIREHSQVLEKMPHDLRSAIYDYSGSSYSSMNGTLRRGKTSDSTDKLIKALNQYGQPLLEDRKMFRHAGLETFEGAFSDEMYNLARDVIRAKGNPTELGKLKSKLMNATFKDKGFLSTAYREGVFVNSDGVEIQLHLPKGFNKGLHIEQISQHETESEYLIQAGTEFKIFDVEYGDVESGYGSKYKNIILKVIPI